MKKSVLMLMVMSLAACINLQALETSESVFDRFYSSKGTELQAAIGEMPVLGAPAPQTILGNTPKDMAGLASSSAPIVLARIDINSGMDRYLRTDVTFKTAKGRVVHVAINGVWKCPDGKCPDGKYPGNDTGWDLRCSYNESIIFLTDDGQLFSAGIEQIINYSIFLVPIKKGHKDIYFDGDNRPYTIKLYVSSLDAAGVKTGVLKITTKGRFVFKTTIAKTLYGIFAKTTPVKMSGKYYTFVGRTLYKNKDGDCGFGLNANLVLIPEPTEEDHYVYPIPVSRITPEGIRCRVDWKYSLRLVGGNVIEIYRP